MSFQFPPRAELRRMRNLLSENPRLVLPAAVLIVLLCAGTAAAMENSKAGPPDNATHTLATEDTLLGIKVLDAGAVITRLTHTGQPSPSETNWVGGGSPIRIMDSCEMDGAACTLKWRAKDVIRNQTPDDDRLTILFVSDQPALECKVHFRARNGPGPVEHWQEFVNKGPKPVVLHHQDSLDVRLVCPKGTEAWWLNKGGNTARRGGVFHQALDSPLDEVLPSGPTDAAGAFMPWAALQVGQSHGLYVGWEFSGKGRVHLQATPSEPTSVRIRVGLHPRFKTTIKPRQVFKVPVAFIGCYPGDMDEGSYRLGQFVYHKLRPPLEGQGCPLVFNNCWLWLRVEEFNMTAASLREAIKWAAELGFETCICDAGWFKRGNAGDWYADEKRFPGGMRPLSDYAHSLGIKFGLWIAPNHAALSEREDAFSTRGPHAHPEWLVADCPPDWQPGAYSGFHGCLACGELLEWIHATLQRVVTSNDLGYLKHDQELIAEDCNRTTHRHSHGELDASYWATLGYYEMMETLNKRFPKLTLEGCMGGGQIKDFGYLAHVHHMIPTDQVDPLTMRMGMYDTTLAIPPAMLLMDVADHWRSNTPGDEIGDYLCRSGMLGVWMLCPSDAATWTDGQRQSVKQSVQIYKDWIRPMLPTAKVHHIFPRPDGVHWDGLFYFSDKVKRGTLYIFRTKADADEKTVKLKGLDANSAYWVWCEDGSIDPREVSGAELMDTGLAITLTAPWSSDLIYLQDASLGKPEQ